MGRRRARTPYVLQPRPRRVPLTADEIDTVLRAADDLIGLGGRNLLTKVLRGSKDKRLLAHGLDASPCYGIWRGRSSEDVLATIDRVIVAGFLTVVHSGRLPVLAYTDEGWDRECSQRIEEFLAEWDRWIDAGVVPASMEYLKDRDRPMILELLERVRATHDARYIPLLERWAAIDYKKVRTRIHDVIQDLHQAKTPRI